MRTSEESKVRVMGIVVDSMSDVLFIDKDKIKNSPDFGGKIDADYIAGLTTVDNNVISLLSTKAMLNLDEINHFSR